MDISEGDIHESPGINASGSLVAGELSREDENIDVTGQVRNFCIHWQLSSLGIRY